MRQPAKTATERSGGGPARRCICSIRGEIPIPEHDLGGKPVVVSGQAADERVAFADEADTAPVASD